MANDFGGAITPDTPILGGLFDGPETAQNIKQGFVEYIRGGQVVRQGVDDKGAPVGAILSTTPLPKSSSAVPKQPVITKDPGDNSQWATSFNPDGSIKNQVQITPPSGPAATATSAGSNALHDAEAKRVAAQTAAVDAMSSINPQLAAGRLAKLQNDIQNNTDLEPARKAQYLARANELGTKAGLDVANTAKAGAQTSLYTAEGQMKLQNSFFAAQQQINTLNSMVGKPGGPATQDEADAEAQQIYDRAARETATGITAEQQQQNAQTLQRQAVDEGNNRASNAASVFNAAQSTAMDAAKNGAGGPAAAGGFLAMLHAAPGFQASMGGSPVVTDDHKQQIASLVMGGMHFPDAVRAVAAKAGVTPGTDAPSVDNGGQVDPNAVNGSEPGPGNFLSNAGAGGLPPGVYQGGAFS